MDTGLRHHMGTYLGYLYETWPTASCCRRLSAFGSQEEFRYGMNDWIRGESIIRAGYEPGQLLNVAKDSILLIIVLLSDQLSYHHSKIKKALSLSPFSDLTTE